MRLTYLLATTAVAGLLAVAAPGATIDLAYSGVDITGSGGSSIGGGSFSTDTMGSVALGDLTSFSFEQTTSAVGQVVTFDYALSDLKSFSATLSGGVLTALSFTTDATAGAPASASFVNEYFSVSSLALGAAGTYRSDGQQLQSGTVTQAAAVPEPASWAMFLGGFGLIGAGLRRRRTGISFA